eukprot:363853-Chlamydomonas_euryale.AAC.4
MEPKPETPSPGLEALEPETPNGKPDQPTALLPPTLCPPPLLRPCPQVCDALMTGSSHTTILGPASSVEVLETTVRAERFGGWVGLGGRVGAPSYGVSSWLCQGQRVRGRHAGIVVPRTAGPGVA